MIRRRRASAVIFGLIAAAPLPMGTASNAATCDRSDFKIVIDIGHSANAPGATSSRGVSEFDFNLRLTSVVEAKLIGRGYHVFRIITPGGTRTLGARATRANALNANLLLSVHHDSAQAVYLEKWLFENRMRTYSDRFRGWSMFVSTDNKYFAGSFHFAKLLADQLLARNLPFTTHHAEMISGEGKSFLDAARGIYRYDGLAVLKLTRAPAILLEAGVIINRAEEIELASAHRQNLIAEAIANAVDEFCADPK